MWIKRKSFAELDNNTFILYTRVHVLSFERCIMGQYVPFDSAELSLLNNFFCHFPIGNDPYPNRKPNGFYRTAHGEHWNTKILELVRGFPFQSKDSLHRYCEGKSDKYLAGTFAEFYAEVDRTVEELGMFMVVVSRTINVYEHNQREAGPEGARHLDEFLAPIYVALRNKGYNKADLCG